MKREASDEYAEIKAPPSLKHRLMSGSAWALGGRAVMVVTALATNALLARLLAPRDLGAYFLAFSVVLIGGAVGQLGLGQAAVRFLAEGIALGHLGRVRRTVTVVLYLGGLGALGVALAYLLLGNVLSTSLFHAPALAAVTGLVAGWMAAMALQNLLAEIFRGFHDIRLATAFNSLIAGVLLTPCLLVLWLIKGHATLTAVMVLVTASFSVSALVGGWTLRRRLAYLSSADPPSADSDSRLGFGQVLSVALPALVANLALFGLLQADIWILGAFRGEKEVAIYGSASRLAMAIMVAIQVLYAVLPPLIVEKHTKNEKETLERLLRGAATASSILMLPLFLAFVLVPGEILKLVYGPYYESGRWILSILSVGIFFNVLTGIRGYVLLITGSERVQLTISVLGGLSNIALCTLGAIYWGIYGVALAAMTMMVLQCLAELVFVRLRRGVWTHFSFGMVRETKLLLDTLKSRRINR